MHNRNTMRRKKEKDRKKVFEAIVTENFSKLLLDTNQDTGSSENKQNKYQTTLSHQKKKKSTLRHIIRKIQKIKDKEKLLKEAREGK